jgi:triosephosphate isomerase
VTQRKPIVGGNWKMNTTLQSASDLIRGIVGGMERVSGVDVVVFPPFPYLLAVGAIARGRSASTPVRLGAQDVFHERRGAFTGEVSVDMLADCGVQVVLTGHSERRHQLGESDHMVGAKTRAVLGAGLECILCVGEKLDERQTGQTDAVNERQLRIALSEVAREHVERLTIAYEPVWAIGTGKTATPADAQDAHFKIRRVLCDLFGSSAGEEIRIMYGGSVKTTNAPSLFTQPDVDGGLIGGASLKATDFVAIAKAAATA